MYMYYNVHVAIWYDLSYTGAQCNEEVRENVRWLRTPADRNATMPCPGANSNNNLTTGT